MTKSYEMNTIFETAINRQIEVQTAAYSFGEEAVSKCEVRFHISLPTQKTVQFST